MDDAGFQKTESNCNTTFAKLRGGACGHAQRHDLAKTHGSNTTDFARVGAKHKNGETHCRVQSFQFSCQWQFLQTLIREQVKIPLGQREKRKRLVVASPNCCQFLGSTSAKKTLNILTTAGSKPTKTSHRRGGGGKITAVSLYLSLSLFLSHICFKDLPGMIASTRQLQQLGSACFNSNRGRNRWHGCHRSPASP